MFLSLNRAVMAAGALAAVTALAIPAAGPAQASIIRQPAVTTHVSPQAATASWLIGADGGTA